MRWGLVAAGVVADFIGSIWIAQGLNMLGGSPMTGQPFWAVAGVILCIVGICAIVVGVRPRPGSSKP
jgi:hypothetical protein